MQRCADGGGASSSKPKGSSAAAAAGCGAAAAGPSPSPNNQTVWQQQPRDASGRFLPRSTSTKRKASAMLRTGGGSGGGSGSGNGAGSPKSSTKRPKQQDSSLEPGTLPPGSSQQRRHRAEQAERQTADAGAGRKHSKKRGNGLTNGRPWLQAALALEPRRAAKGDQQRGTGSEASGSDGCGARRRGGGGGRAAAGSELDLTSDEGTDTFSDLEDFIVCDAERDYARLMAAKARARRRRAAAAAAGVLQPVA